MQIAERTPGDLTTLSDLAARERDARKRDRLRAALLALRGKEAGEIAEMLGRSRRQVQVWVYAYRDGGIDAIHPPPQPGRKAKLPREREAELRARLDAGPRPEDGVCTLRGKDVVRILEREFGVSYSLEGAYALLHRLDYSTLRPRPRHEKRDPARQEAFKERAPFVDLVTRVAKSLKHSTRVFFMDEARFGQQGTLTNVWARKGSRPTAVRQTRYEWVHLFAAVEPATGASSALLAPYVNTQTMNVFLRQLVKEELKPKEHAIVIMDQAGWHKSAALEVPEEIEILLLPPYSPELNPIENLWHWMRSHYLSNRAYEDYDGLMRSGTEAWRRLTPEILKTVCSCPYLERAS